MTMKVYDQIDELIRENKRLRKLVDDLLVEIHPMEDK